MRRWLNCVHGQRLHVLPSSSLRRLHKPWAMRCSIRNEIMDGNQGYHVILCEHGAEASKVWVSVAYLIDLFNATMPMSWTDIHSEVPISHFLSRLVGVGCQALDFSVQGKVCVQNVAHAYMLTKCKINLKPRSCGKAPRSRSVVLLDRKDPTCFSNLQH